MTHWISTKASLPKQNTVHLSLLEGDVPTEATPRLYVGNGEWVYLDGSKSDLPVAFWMELPEVPVSRVRSDEEAADSLLGALFGGSSSSPAPEAPREPDPIEPPFTGGGGETGGGGASASWDDNSGTQTASSDNSSSGSSDSGSSDSGSSDSSDS